MSAFVVSRKHIDALVRAGLELPGHYGPLRWGDYDENGHWQRTGELTPETADEVGQMLTDECVRSVSYRYPDNGDLPGSYPDGEPDWLPAYRYPAPDRIGGMIQIVGTGARELTPLEVLRGLGCYEYQSCEHPGWATSEARQFCEALKDTAIHALPGFDQADREF